MVSSESGARRLLVHAESSKAWGGQEIRIFTELLELPKRGWTVELWAPEDSEIFRRSTAAGISASPVPFRGVFDLGSIVRVRNLILNRNPGCVVTHSSIDSWVTGFATRILAAARRPALVRARHLSTPIRNFLSYRWFPDAIVSTSDAIRKSIVMRGIPPERVVSIPTGVDLSRFKPASLDAAQKAAIRKKYNLPADRHLVGGVFVVRTWKGIFDFVRIAAAVPDADFVVAGDGPSLHSMKETAAELRVTGRMHFLGHVESVEEIYAALDVFLLPSTGHEGVPQSLMQAAACGIPVAASRLPSIAEALPDGWLCPPGDIACFAESIRSILADPENTRARAARSRVDMETRYDQRRILDRIDAFYRGFLLCS